VIDHHAVAALLAGHGRRPGGPDGDVGDAVAQARDPSGRGGQHVDAGALLAMSSRRMSTPL